jgi:hypothetical protein
MLSAFRRLFGQQQKAPQSSEASKQTLLRLQKQAARTTVTFERKPSGLPGRSK